MGETHGNDQDIESEDDQSSTESLDPVADGECPDPAGNGDVAIEDQASGLPWKRIAVAAGGVALTVAGTVVATLAATHKTARHENAAAYAHGLVAAVEAIRNGYDPFED